MKKNRVVYLYDEDIGGFLYGKDHPMKPQRIKMTHSMVMAYDLLSELKVITPRRASPEEMSCFHTEDYVRFLQTTTFEDMKQKQSVASLFNVIEDTPFFPGLFEFCRISAGGSITAAEIINKGKADIAINWAGGLHHAKKGSASGFCYVADCVLGILKLLERYQRVMYVDIDVHHGDGVEEAFYLSDRVLTVSFHKYGDFFPGTGSLSDIGYGKGKYYSVNVPLLDGIGDESYHSVFKPIIQRLIEWFRPEAIFLQSGADSVVGDKLGVFNLSIKGHAECVRFLKSFGIPMIVSGGGGYSIRNVARCWTYETAVLVDKDISNEIPNHSFIDFYAPDYSLNQKSCRITNINTPTYLNRIIETVFDNMRHLPCAPSYSLINGQFKSSNNEELDHIFDEGISSYYLSLKPE